MPCNEAYFPNIFLLVRRRRIAISSALRLEFTFYSAGALQCRARPQASLFFLQVRQVTARLACLSHS